MTSKVKIFNLALTAMGSARVNDPEDEGDKATTLREAYDDVLDAVLEAHPWNFAKRRASVAADAETPAFGYAKQYTYPANPFCLRVWRLEDRTIEWESEGRKILTDAGAPLQFRFIARITDTSLFSGNFVMALAARLAAETAFRITNELGKEDRAWELYSRKIAEARGVDGQEGKPPPNDESDFIDARS